MRNQKLLNLLIVGLLMLPGLMSAEYADSTHYVEMTGHYEAIRLALLTDSMDGVMDHAKALEEQASSLRENITAEQAGVAAHDLEDCAAALGDIETAAMNLAEASGLEAAREEFFVLTKPMAKYRKLTGDETTIVAYCSMARKAWIQPDRELGNPYYGQKMPTCGEVVGES